MLQINHYTKQYSTGGPKAVDDLSLHIKPGEIYGFLGHNGAGKTTTIKACCGILDFTEGEILVNGMSIKKQPLECKRIMAYIPDNPDLYDFLSKMGKGCREVAGHSGFPNAALAVDGDFLHDDIS